MIRLQKWSVLRRRKIKKSFRTWEIYFDVFWERRNIEWSLRGNRKHCSKGFHASGFPFIRALRALVFGRIISSKPHKCTIKKSFWLLWYDRVKYISISERQVQKGELRRWQITLMEPNMIKYLLKQWKEKDYTFLQQQVFLFIVFPWKGNKNYPRGLVNFKPIFPATPSCPRYFITPRKTS